MKMKTCPICKKKVATNNKGKRVRHPRWNWHRWPEVGKGYPSSGEMHEVKCEGSQL